MWIHKPTLNINWLVSIGMAVFILIAVFIVDNRIVSKVGNEYAAQLDETLTTNISKTQLFIEGKIQLINLIYNTPPIQGISRAIKNDGIDPFDGTSKALWEARLSTIFASTLKAYPEVSQVRLIDATNGMEWIRTDRALAGVDILPKAKLQDKSDRDYFVDALKLMERAVYVSQISLNREKGQIEYPYKPVMRFAIPTYNIENEIFAVLVMNVDANALFEQIHNINEFNSGLFLTNEKRNVIYSDMDWMQYWSDLKPDVTMQTAFNISAWSKKGISRISSGHYDSDWLSKSSFIRLPGKNENHGIYLNSFVDYSNYQKQIWQARFDAYFILSIVFVVFIIVFFTLSTSLQRARQLNNVRTEFEGIINGSASAIIAVKLDGKIFSANDAAKKYFPELHGELRALHFESISLLPKHFIDDAISCIAARQQAEKWSCEQVLSDGQKIDVEYSASRIENADGTLVGIAIIAEDISERKTAERQLAQSNENPQDLVKARTRELEVAKNKAEQVSEVKSIFISTVSHEMRTPLNGIMGTLRMLKSEPLSNNQLRYLEMSETSCETLNALINDVLDLSKIEAGKFELEKEDFNVISVIEHACLSLAVKANEKSLDFILDVDDIDVIALKGDASRIRQIIFNLLSNAIKFTHNGYVKLFSYTERCNESVILHIDVSDTGIGIAKDKQDKLFKSFVQADATIAGNFGGTGLGLSISKRLAEFMGGRVSLTSTEGVGSTFSLTIPFAVSETVKRPESQFLQDKSFDFTAVQQLSFTPPLMKIIKRYGGQIQQDNADYHVHYVTDENRQLLDIATSKDIYVVESFFDASDDIVHILRKPIRILCVIQMFAPELATSLIKIDSQVNLSGTEALDLVLLSGIHLLVVDDNAINLEVAKGIFKDTDVEVETAQSGQEAIKRLAAQESGYFDAILLDINMPNMNGYETAQFIRTEPEVAHYCNVPIIAMTANAMTGEYDRCINAGMNDYATKPVIPAQLIEKLVVQLKRESGQKTGSERICQKQNPNSPSTSAVDHKSAMKLVGNNVEVHKKVCSMFLEQAPGKMKKLQDSISTNDKEAAIQVSHDLKGVAANVGATMFSRKCGEIERDLKSDVATNEAQISDAARMLDDVICEIRTYTM